jgi:DNA polymerase III delta prime subunit
MQTIIVSATKARNNFFELLNQVEKGHEVLIEKDKKSSKKRNKGFLKAVEAVRGIWKDYDPEDNPLRRKGSADFLGKWDK